MMMIEVALQLAVHREALGEGHEWRHQLLLVRPLHHAATTTKIKNDSGTYNTLKHHFESQFIIKKT